MKIACVIVSAGQGTRLGDEWKHTPKALVPILGRPMLYYSLNAFDDFNGIDNRAGITRFVVTSPPDHVAKFEKIIASWGFSIPTTVVKGGETRSESVSNALTALEKDSPDIVMIHDCARCCLTSSMIKKLSSKIPSGDGATLAHPQSDTLRLVLDNRISDELQRDVVACIETPQVFPYRRILELHLNVPNDPKHHDPPPDDTTLFTRAGETVHVVYHGENNIKVTYPEDIGAAEGILFSRGWMDVGDEEE